MNMITNTTPIILSARWEETNEFADPEKANNGGGYSQPSIEIVFSDGVKCFINDTSCGDFGTRVSACFQIGSDNWVANWGNMEDRYESEIPEKLFAEHIWLIMNQYGYCIPTKEQCFKWDAEKTAKFVVFRHGDDELVHFAKYKDARKHIRRALKQFTYKSRENYGLKFSISGFNDPDKDGYVASATYSIKKL